MENTMSKLELQGRFDAFEAQGAKEWLKNEVDKLGGKGKPANILVDMSEVNFIDSAGLAALVVGTRKASEHGGMLHLFGLQKAVQIIFELSWLDKAFPIYASEAEAVKAFAQV